MKRWEYLTFDAPQPGGSGSNGEAYQARLNELGAQGWEVVAVVEVTTICKRLTP